MQRLVVLISGQGSNMLALAEAARRERWPAQWVAVLSDKSQAPGLAKARDLGLPTGVIEPLPGESRLAYDERLAQALEALAPDWILLAGFMRILGEPLIRRFTGRIINIHPSLLPAFPGLHTHRQALQAGATRHGATVHLVIPALDAGPILGQDSLSIAPGEDERSLAARVLALEHRLYPRIVGELLEGQLRPGDGPKQQGARDSTVGALT